MRKFGIEQLKIDRKKSAKMIKRLCVFSFYDRDGIVDSYVEYLLDSLAENVSDLFIVVNGSIIVESEKKLKKYTSNIIIRANKGFDAGAYFDLLVTIIGKEQLKKWDEVILCNDTFYGPFFPFKDILSDMNAKENDFWGLSYVENNITNHIQSYFLVFRKKIIQNGDLFEYFNTYVDAETQIISDVYAFFEVGILDYLTRCGYQFGVFTDVHNYNIYSSADICIERYGLPILKRKAFEPGGLEREGQLNILKYLVSKTDYNVNYILENIQRLYGIDIVLDDIIRIEYDEVKKGKKNIVSAIGSQGIINFLKKHEVIYIYGIGTFAKRIWFLYYRYMKYFNGFIISDNQKMTYKYWLGFPIEYYNNIESGAAIIVAMNIENSKKIKQNLKVEDQALFIW